MKYFQYPTALLILATFITCIKPLDADILNASDLGSPGDLGQGVRQTNLRVLTPYGSSLFLGASSVGVTDDRVSGDESLSIFFDRSAQIDAVTLENMDLDDSPIQLAGFEADPRASITNGTAVFANGVVTLTPTSSASSVSISFASPQTVDFLILTSPSTEGDGVGLSVLQYTLQKQVLYREEFPNGLRVSRPLADLGWDASSAIGSSFISPTAIVVVAGELGTGDLGGSASVGSLSFSSSGSLYVAEEANSISIGIVGSYKNATISQGENFDVTPNTRMVVDAIQFSGFGSGDSPVILSGFSADPGATLDNGTASYSGGSVTLNATSFSELATVSFSNNTVLSSLNIRCNSSQGGAAGVGIASLTYREASIASITNIAGVFGDDYAVVESLMGDPSLKAIVSTETDWIDNDLSRYTGLELRWEQAGGTHGANVGIRPMIEIAGQWYASATLHTIAADESAFSDETLPVTTTAADWLEVDLYTGSANIGSASASDLSGAVTNLGFLVDFSADNEDQTVYLDQLELAGTPLFPDEEPWTIVSSPDFTNADIADMSGAITGVPASSGWDGGQNGTTAEIEDSFLAFFQSMTSEAPDLFMVAGDLVEGEWFKDRARRKLIGPINNNANRELAFIEGSYYYYGHYQNAWFRENGLRVIASVGDHELGDNEWHTNGDNTNLIPTMRNEFSRWFCRFPIGQWSTYTAEGRPDRNSPDFADTPAPLLYPDRPIGSVHEQTAFAIRHKDTLIVSVDVFKHEGPNTFLYPYGGTVKAELEAQQLAWVQSLLADAAADSSIRHIITQSHTPILQPVLTTASSGMTYVDGESSDLFQAMKTSGVDLHFSGETHDIAASLSVDGVQQIVHGAPPGSRVMNYLLVRVHPDKLQCEIKTARHYRDNSVKFWQPQDGNGNNGFAEMRESFTTKDSLLIDKSGTEKVVTLGSGLLANIEHDDYLLHYSFDYPAGTKQMSNEGTLPDTNADGQKKWRGDLDSAWLGTPDFVTGKFGSALNFAGIDDNPDIVFAGECPTPTSMPRTMAFWIKTTSSAFMNIAGFGGNAAAFGEFNAQMLGDGTLQLDIGEYTASALNSPAINDGVWHHCVIVVPAWDQSDLGDVLFYIDGIEYTANTSNPTIQILTKTTSTAGKLLIGRHAINRYSPLVGQLDEFTIWGRGLSAAEIAQLHAFGDAEPRYDVAQADLLLKAFRFGESVEIGGVTWYFESGGLRGAAGTLYDLGDGYLVPFASGSGMTTFENPGDWALKADIFSSGSAANTVTLDWNSLPGASYEIQTSMNLNSWDTLSGAENILSEGFSTSYEVEASNDKSFFIITERP